MQKRGTLFAIVFSTIYSRPTAYLTEFPTEANVFSLLTAIFDEVDNSQKSMPFKVIGYFHELLGEIQRNGLYTATLSLESVRDEQKVQKRLSADLTVTRIAEDCGFRALRNFIKTFKTCKGVPRTSIESVASCPLPFPQKSYLPTTY